MHNLTNYLLILFSLFLLEHKAAALYIHPFHVLCLPPCCHLQIGGQCSARLSLLFCLSSFQVESIWGLLWGRCPGPLGGRVWTVSVYFQLHVYEVTVKVDLGTTSTTWLAGWRSLYLHISLLTWASLCVDIFMCTYVYVSYTVWTSHVPRWIFVLGPEQILSHSQLPIEGFPREGFARVCYGDHHGV